MSEEKVEKVEVQPVEGGDAKKKALVSFILSLVGFALGFAPFVCLGSIVLGIVSLSLHKKSAGVTEKPHTIFRKIAKPFGIIDIIAGAVMFVVYLLVIVILPLIAVAVGA